MSDLDYSDLQERLRRAEANATKPSHYLECLHLLKRIAEMEEEVVYVWAGNYVCFYCHANRWETVPSEPHKPDCIWLLAKQLLDQT